MLGMGSGMIKCPHCNSCLRFVTVDGVMYLFCSLEWRIYKKVFDGVQEVTTDYLVTETKKQIGTTIIL
jgi:hypothetical protein